jgi:oligosaccharide repeat unit polymerase
MLEVLIILTLTGCFLANSRKLGLANPFQIYFLTWLLLFTGYYLSRESFIPVSTEFLLLMIVAKAIALVIVLLVGSKKPNLEVVNAERWMPQFKKRYVAVAQLIVLAAAPFAFARAGILAGEEDIFSATGYVKLRTAITNEGESLGFFSYFSLLSAVVCSATVLMYRNRETGLIRLVVSIVLGLFFAYLSTGRTFVLLFFILSLLPLVIVGTVKIKGLAVAAAIILIAFFFSAAMTSKGVSFEAGLSENIESFLENIRGYTVAPLLAFSKFLDTLPNPSFGENTFRTVFSLLYSLDITSEPPISLVRGFEYVPDPTNVYTVYEVYVRDFWYAGAFLPPAFLIGHWWLYRKARGLGGKWIFFYSASVYPLAMQFFQDQYFSLLSMWIQLLFWYWIFLMPVNRPVLRFK